MVMCVYQAELYLTSGCLEVLSTIFFTFYTNILSGLFHQSLFYLAYDLLMAFLIFYVLWFFESYRVS